MKKYLLKTSTNWCGEDTTQGVITDNVEALEHLFQLEAYDRFNDFDGPNGVLQDLFPDEEEYSDEQIAEAEKNEESYFSYSIEEFDESAGEEWDWFDIFIDESK